ncbi:MAG: type I restriction-modification system subunit M [Gammaproteobacteria bacterium AqS3]|nr:type I restriction-modification system subunit M [Gammaproteobacteria bacterium AqS3]
MTETKKNTGDLEFAAELFKAADKLRSHLEPSEYKHVVLGLIFLKYISDAFEARRAELEEEDPELVEEPDEYLAENIFWVPEEARWSYLRDNAKLTEIKLSNGRKGDIGQLIDQAMEAIERFPSNENLKGALSKNYGRLTIDKRILGELIDLFSNIPMYDGQAKDLLGRVYEYFLASFASSEGKRGGEFFTPRSVVRTLVEMLEPSEGRVYDPCCGSGGMFVQSDKFISDHGGRRNAISVYGQEINHTVLRLAKMNLAIQGIDAQLRFNNSFLKDELPDLRADFILANPPFNTSDWGGDQLQDDVRWSFGSPPTGNANFAWLQHIYYHLAERGTAGVVLANGSMSSQQSGEGAIRTAMIEKDAVDAMVALPGQLFYSTQIPACLWILAKDKTANGHRDRRGEILFIDARDLGYMADRVRREFSDKDIAKIADTYHHWRNKDTSEAYQDIPGFCKSTSLDEIKENDFVLTPGRYVGMPEVEDDGIPFSEKFASLRGQLEEQMTESAKLDNQIKESFGLIQER